MDTNDVLPEITMISDDNVNTFNVLANLLPHYPFFLQPPDYYLSSDITYLGDSPFSDQKNYHVNIASILMLGKWFDFLKENDVYNNTRIIVVADHGREYHSKFPDDVILPDGTSLMNYNALLLVKDFNATGNMRADDKFMTNADVPLIALEGIVENPVNPFTGKLIRSNKADGVTITTSSQWNTNRDVFSYSIKSNEWLHVNNNIFDIDNWHTVILTHEAPK